MSEHQQAAPGCCSPRHMETVRQVCRMIDASEDSIPTLAELGAEVGASPHHLQRLFKGVMGISPRQYAEARRLERFKSAVKDGETVSSAMYGAGYGSSSRLYEKSDLHLGMTPASYARGGAGAAITFAIVDCRLGRLLVAATERGICAVSLGDDDGVLAAELCRDYPAADIQRDDGAFADWVAAVLAITEGREPAIDLPLDIRATAFQWQVWQRLRAIPAGETATYGEIAADLGRPKGARAVGRACACNPVSLIVPCHRAVGGDGRLTGYRWGIDRKETLLETERGGRAGGDGKR